jgi:hypothetical protein
MKTNSESKYILNINKMLLTISHFCDNIYRRRTINRGGTDEYNQDM